MASVSPLIRIKHGPNSVQIAAHIYALGTRIIYAESRNRIFKSDIQRITITKVARRTIAIVYSESDVRIVLCRVRLVDTLGYGIRIILYRYTKFSI